MGKKKTGTLGKRPGKTAILKKPAISRIEPAAAGNKSRPAPPPGSELSAPRFRPGMDGRGVELDPQMNLENALALIRAFGTEELDLIWHFLEQLAGTVPQGSDMATKLNRCLPILHGLRPRDELEAMLILQMTGIHNCAMECLRRVHHPHQAPEGVEANINRTVALTKVFLSQLEALQKYREKGSRQTVVVKHVHVNQGGQAIVGKVHHQGRVGGGDDDQD